MSETAVDFEVVFTDGSARRVTAREVPNTALWEAGGCRGISPERAASLWALNKGECDPCAGIASIRRSALPGVKHPVAPPADAAAHFVIEFASDAFSVLAQVADAAREVLNGAQVRTVKVGAASDGAWSIEDAENAIYTATWGRPVTGYVVGLGREMVVVLKRVSPCP